MLIARSRAALALCSMLILVCLAGTATSVASTDETATVPLPASSSPYDVPPFPDTVPDPSEPLVSRSLRALPECSRNSTSYTVAGGPCSYDGFTVVEEPTHRYALVEARTVAVVGKPVKRRLLVEALSVRTGPGAPYTDGDGNEAHHSVSYRLPVWGMSGRRIVHSELLLVDVTAGRVVEHLERAQSRVRARGVKVKRAGGVTQVRVRVLADKGERLEFRSSRCKPVGPLCSRQWRSTEQSRPADELGYVDATWWAPSRVTRRARPSSVRYDLDAPLHIEALRLRADASTPGYRAELGRVAVRDKRLKDSRPLMRDLYRDARLPTTALTVASRSGKVEVSRSDPRRFNHSLYLSRAEFEQAARERHGEDFELRTTEKVQSAVVVGDYSLAHRKRVFEVCECGAFGAPLRNLPVEVERTRRGFRVRWYSPGIGASGQRLEDTLYVQFGRFGQPGYAIVVLPLPSA